MGLSIKFLCKKTTEGLSSSKQNAIQALLYGFAWFLSYLHFYLAVAITMGNNWFSPYEDYDVYMMAVVFTCLQGFWHSVVYFRQVYVDNGKNGDDDMNDDHDLEPPTTIAHPTEANTDPLK